MLDGINDEITLNDGATLYGVPVARATISFAGSADLSFGLQLEEA